MKLSDVISGPKLEPPRITIYGGAGVGKSTLQPERRMQFFYRLKMGLE